MFTTEFLGQHALSATRTEGVTRQNINMQIYEIIIIQSTERSKIKWT
jgi:hypothetical protein